MNQNDLKRKTALAALDYVTDGEVLGVGTGSTVDFLMLSKKPGKSRPPVCQVPSAPAKNWKPWALR